MAKKMPQREARREDVAEIVRIMIEDDEAIEVLIRQHPTKKKTHCLIDETVPG